MLTIEKKDYERIIEQARESKPNEICGILAGKNYKVLKIYQMNNTSDNPRFCYFIDPKEQLMVFKNMRKENMELVGIYHSHPETEAYPSKRDIELAFYPEAIYVIISLQNEDNPSVRGFRIVNGRIKEIKIIVE